MYCQQASEAQSDDENKCNMELYGWNFSVIVIISSFILNDDIDICVELSVVYDM